MHLKGIFELTLGYHLIILVSDQQVVLCQMVEVNFSTSQVSEL